MKSPYDLITISFEDLEAFEANENKGKVWLILSLVLDELPKNLKGKAGFIAPTLTPIPGFRDEHVQGLEVSIKESSEIEKFVREFVPFFILRKKEP
ncbi:MAG: hypothetical protein ABIE03_06370 [Patescibacteria group bacterium]|nr:hypothetical protein [Patescibacteria group bacterium]